MFSNLIITSTFSECKWLRGWRDALTLVSIFGWMAKERRRGRRKKKQITASNPTLTDDRTHKQSIIECLLCCLFVFLRLITCGNGFRLTRIYGKEQAKKSQSCKQVSGGEWKRLNQDFLFLFLFMQTDKKRIWDAQCLMRKRDDGQCSHCIMQIGNCVWWSSVREPIWTKPENCSGGNWV